MGTIHLNMGTIHLNMGTILPCMDITLHRTGTILTSTGIMGIIPLCKDIIPTVQFKFEFSLNENNDRRQCRRIG